MVPQVYLLLLLKAGTISSSSPIPLPLNPFTHTYAHSEMAGWASQLCICDLFRLNVMNSNEPSMKARILADAVLQHLFTPHPITFQKCQKQPRANQGVQGSGKPRATNLVHDVTLAHTLPGIFKSRF